METMETMERAHSLHVAASDLTARSSDPLIPHEQSFERRVSKGGMSLKPRFCGFGYLPLKSELVPLSNEEEIDWAALSINITAGLVMGLRETLGGIVSASIVFSTSDVAEISSMLQFGITMTLYTLSVGILWYAIFGRLQYGYGTQQDLICILQAQLAAQGAHLLADTPERIPATVFAIICLSAVLTGVASIIVGKLSWATVMLMIPRPVVKGFLGAIGVIVLQAALTTTSGIKFHYFCPQTGWQDLFSSGDRLCQMCCMVGHFLCIQLGPKLFHICFSGRKNAVDKFAPLVCQLFPLVLFYCCTFALGVRTITLAEHGWTYPNHGSNGPLGLWTTYSFADVDVEVLQHVLMSRDLLALVAMAILCTMLGALAITGHFPEGPHGDPAPDAVLDYNAELTTVGAASIALGLTGGNLIFHKFSVIQLREDGGTHRVAVITMSLCAGSLLIFDFPIGSYVPKWFLGGLFLNTGWLFLRKTLLSYQTLARLNWKGMKFVSPQYGISMCCVATAFFYSPTTAILAGLCLSIVLFVIDGIKSSPVHNVVDGKHVVSRTKRPFWEMAALAKEGDRIRLLYLQGNLFFGSISTLTMNLAAAARDKRIEFCILSFARVLVVDPSAAEILKSATDKIKKRGCHVIFCRVNKEVFETLCMANVVRAPDTKLMNHAQQAEWKNVLSERKGEKQHPDVFYHETEALDYCDDYLVKEFCYKEPFSDQLDPYMKEYRKAVHTSGVRLPECIFEQMNDLAPGTMEKVRSFCEVLVDVPAGMNLSEEKEMDRALCFILKGSLSVVQIIPTRDESHALDPKRGFTFYPGKNLVTRYPPGHVAGSATFFRFRTKQFVDPELQPNLIVSSHFHPPAEIWILRRHPYTPNGTDKPIPGWKDIPADLRASLGRMFCAQFADSHQHSQLKER